MEINPEFWDSNFSVFKVSFVKKNSNDIPYT